jgi:hypothetical protein
MECGLQWLRPYSVRVIGAGFGAWSMGAASVVRGRRVDLRCDSIYVYWIDVTDNLYQFDREYNSVRKGPVRASFGVSLRLHLRIFRPASNGVRAERSEFIGRAWTPLFAGLIDSPGGEGRLNPC